MTYYYCDACHYCFEAESLPDCGADLYNNKPVVRLATKDEIKELIRIRAEDDECDPIE